MPLRIAVAGITNGLSYAIVSALLDTPDLEVVILTRASSSAVDLSHFASRGVVVKPVDYSSIPDLTSALNGVDTVICTILVSQPALHLIVASKAVGVRRFMPSEFAFSVTANARVRLYQHKREVLAALEESGLEYTLIQNGLFMDFLASGAPKPLESPRRMPLFVVDIASRKATIPGTGDEKMTFTTHKDIGRFVAVAVKLNRRWPKELGIEGETTTYNQVVREAEAIIGKKFEVEYLDRGRLASAIEESRDDEMMTGFYEVLDVIASGYGVVGPSFNRLAPQITVTPVRDFLFEYWST